MQGLEIARLSLPRGGGAFRRVSAAIGIFLNDQPGHRLALGRDRAEPRPLSRYHGWMLPAGSEGVCLYDSDLELVTVAFDSELLTEAGFTAQTVAFRPYAGPIDPVLLALALEAEIGGAASALYRETMKRALAARFVHVVGEVDEAIAAIDDRRLRRALNFIHDRLGEDLRLSELAAEAAMSTSQFARAFHRVTGRSPLQYVIEQRLQRASVLLRTTRLAIAEIAHRVGYADVSRFGQHFRRRFGVTPAAARRG